MSRDVSSSCETLSPAKMGGGIIVRVMVPVIMLALVGCGTGRAPTNYASEDHLLDGKVTKGGGGFFQAYEDSKKDDDNPGLAVKYVNRGVLLSKTACHSYLDSLEAEANRLEFSKDQFALTAVLATGVLALTGSSTDAFEGLALGSAFVLGTADNVRDHYLLGPDSDAVIALVKKSLAAVEEEIANNPPQTFDMAFQQLFSYSRLCTTAEVRRLVRGALGAAEPLAVQELRDTTDQILRNKIAELVGPLPAVTNEQFVGLYWMTTRGVKDASEQTIIDGMLGAPLAATVMGNTALQGDVRDEFQKMSGKARGNLDKAVEDKVAEVAAAAAALAAGGPIPATGPMGDPIPRPGSSSGDIEVRF